MTPADSFLETLGTFRELLGMHLCIKVLRTSKAAGTLLEKADGKFNLHQSDFCMGVKRKWNQRCKECDLRGVPSRCEREKKVFLHTCHAGANEVIVPVFADNTLTAVAYVGQFRRTRSQPDELPKKSAQESRGLLRMGELLRAYLTESLHTPLYVSPGSREFRREAIGSFLRRNSKNSPDLAALAKHLGLSVGRTGNVVKEVSGHSFAELRASLRREHAKDLLTGTYYKISQIAVECGFSSPEYFHRFFRKATGLTPAAYRKKHRTEA